MAASARPRIALLYPGDRAMRDRADPAESRFAALFAAFEEAGLAAEPAVWHDDFADEVREQLLRARVVLVWCNPIEAGLRRDRLDALLTELDSAGVFVSTHPDAIGRLGTKDVLYDTRALPFGSDVWRLDSLDQLRRELPGRLLQGPRVLKQHRGHSGIGVWRVEIDSTPAGGAAGGALRARHAMRGGAEETVSLDALCERLAPYFEPEAGGHMLDQAWQPRIAEGMLRAYLVGERVAGFGHQAINALHPDEPQPGPRLYHPPDAPPFQGLRRRLESGWIRLLCEHQGVRADRIPLLWDCDFMYGTPRANDPEPWVLCEINVSSVSPFPPSAISPLVEAVRRLV
jgi:hypothetical protein